MTASSFRPLALLAALSTLTLVLAAHAQEGDDARQIRQVVGVYFRGTPAADEASRTRVIDVVDKVGTAAMVKATLKHGTTTFTDYFVLLKSDGRWLIANKVYHAQR